MARNICIFSDGTGQGGSVKSATNTNVFRLYSAAQLADPLKTRQVCSYDPGLGWRKGDDADRSWWRRLQDKVSQLTGLGISQNIKDCYDAMIQEYTPGDRIFLFGFSRGAYTVRSLGGVLKHCGVPRHGPGGLLPKGDETIRKALVEEAVEQVYKLDGSADDRLKRGQRFRDDYGSDRTPPYFIGVWDTVRALGLPGTGDIFHWRHEFHDATLDAGVFRARQALAIDEARDVYAPHLWDEADGTAPDRIRQIWFSGAHSDVGGGYAEHGLADLTLDWMVQEATVLPNPLLVDRAALALRPDPLARQHDELITSRWPWKRGLRRLSARDHLAPAVRERFEAAAAPILDDLRPYRPEGLRAHPDVAPFYPPMG